MKFRGVLRKYPGHFVRGERQTHSYWSWIWNWDIWHIRIYRSLYLSGNIFKTLWFLSNADQNPDLQKKEWRLANDTVNTIIETDWYGKPKNHSCSRGLCWKGTFPPGKCWPFPFSLTLNNSTYFDVVSSSIELHQNVLINEIWQRAIFTNGRAYIHLWLFIATGYNQSCFTWNFAFDNSSLFFWKYGCLTKEMNLGLRSVHSFDLILIWKCQRI